MHTLQVEQEIEGDDVTVLEHILNCDVERNELLAKLKELSDLDENDLSE